MKVRIGIAQTDKLVELDVEDVDAFRKELEEAMDGGRMGWFVDSKGRTVGVPGERVAFVEFEDSERAKTVGFAPSG